MRAFQASPARSFTISAANRFAVPRSGGPRTEQSAPHPKAAKGSTMGRCLLRSPFGMAGICSKLTV
eukprot:15482090-Alexandrium_andersonii.AAC.1